MRVADAKQISIKAPGIYRWRIILADTDFFQQSVSAADYRGRLNRPSTFYQIR